MFIHNFDFPEERKDILIKDEHLTIHDVVSENDLISIFTEMRKNNPHFKILSIGLEDPMDIKTSATILQRFIDEVVNLERIEIVQKCTRGILRLTREGHSGPGEYSSTTGLILEKIKEEDNSFNAHLYEKNAYIDLDLRFKLSFEGSNMG
jgi:hypothetical protein